MDFDFTGRVVEWRGPAPFWFVEIPREVSEDIKLAARGLEYWGQVPVVASIDGVEFFTGLFPKDGVYLLPLKVAVRKAAEIDVEEPDLECAVEMRLGRDRSDDTL